MTPTETVAFLRNYNVWRRGNLDDQPMPDPREIGEAIDAAIEMIDRLEAAESECLEESRLNGMGSEREAALMAKLEAAEKERDDVAWQLAQSEQGKRKISEECDALRAAVRHEADCVDAAKAEIEALRSELVDLRSSMAFRTSLVGRIAAERDALRAKVEVMEKQEPAGWIGLGPRDGRNEFSTHRPAPSVMRDFNVKPLYLAPGAKGE